MEGKLFLKYGLNDKFGPKKRKMIFSEDLNDFCWVSQKDTKFVLKK